MHTCIIKIQITKTSCDNCSYGTCKFMLTLTVKYNPIRPIPNLYSNPNPNLNHYPTLNRKPNHYPHSNSLLLEISSQEQLRRSKGRITNQNGNFQNLKLNMVLIEEGWFFWLPVRSGQTFWIQLEFVPVYTVWCTCRPTFKTYYRLM